MATKVKPTAPNVTLLVNEKGLSTGSGELADGIAGNDGDTSEIRSEVVVARPTAPGTYTYSLISGATGSYGTLVFNSNGSYTYTLTPSLRQRQRQATGTRPNTNRDSSPAPSPIPLVHSPMEHWRRRSRRRCPDRARRSAAATGRVPATGNVLTDGTPDSFGADGPTVAGGGVVGVARGSVTSSPVTTGVAGAEIVGDYGTLTVNANGGYSYTPNGAAPAGSTVTDSFVYTIRDGDGDMATTTMGIAVTGVAGSGFNVRDFGAKGDGVTNNQAAIQAAINAAHAAGGGVVDVPAGTYIIGMGGPSESDGPIELLSGVTLKGAGMGATVLKLMDNAPQKVNGFSPHPVGEAARDVGLIDLTLDGNRANNSLVANAFFCGVLPGSALASWNVTVAMSRRAISAATASIRTNARSTC